MNTVLPISVFIITLNEADRVARAINSVNTWVDEVIVIDSGSSDNTVEVASQSGAKVFHHDWNGYGLQKRFGEDQCKNRWLLNIDADEEVTDELAKEIQGLFAQGEPVAAGYILQARDLLPGEKFLAPLAHTNYVLRLYNREKGRFSDSPVHDSVILHTGEATLLSAPLLHRSFRSLAHAIDKMNYYSGMQAENLQKKGLHYPLLRLTIEFPFAFLKDYILRGYVLRGRHGFVNSVLYGFTRFIRIAKYLELQDRQRDWD